MKTPIVPLSVRWPRPSPTETDASDLVSAASYCRFKHIRIEAVVVAELKFRDVQRHIFGRHFVECAYHATLENAPKTLNRVRMNRADNVLMAAVVNGCVGNLVWQPLVTSPSISRQQTDFVGANLVDEAISGVGGHARQNARNHIALTFHGADDRYLVFFVSLLFIPMPVLVLSTDECFVHFDDAAEFDARIDERRADFVAHAVGRLVATKAHEALDLKGAHPLLTRQHQMGDAEPIAKRLLRVLKNRARQGRETVALWRAFAALPVEGFVARRIVEVRIAAARAMNAFRPAARHEVPERGFFVTKRETGLELGRRHLRDWFRAVWHSLSPTSVSVGAYCHA